MTDLVTLPWLENRFLDLVALQRQNKLPHALLVKGPSGIGIESLARQLALSLLCDQVTDSGRCGQCKACQLVDANTHPDFLTIQLEDNAKALKIDQIRKLNEFANKTAQQGGNKVAIIDPADQMNVNAANALLKNLEEPAPGTFMILVTSRFESMLATIKSRCRIVDLQSRR